jgi:hypothetical protein
MRVAKEASFSVGRFIVSATPVAPMSEMAKSLAETPGAPLLDPPPIGTPTHTHASVTRWRDERRETNPSLEDTWS